MLLDPLGRHLQKRVWPHCLAWVRFKKWRPASVDPADHSRYDAYLKRWRRKNARRELEETLRREDDREAGKHAQGGGSMEFFHDSFVEDDESDQRLGTFQRHRQSAKHSQMRWAEHHWHWRTGKMNRKWASGPTKWEFEFDSGQESHSDEDRTSRGSEGEFRGWEEAGPGGMTWNPAMFQHLRVLGLPKSAQLDGKKLRDAFYRCALAWHPDRHQGSEKNSAEAKFKAAQAAYHALRAHVSSR